MLTRGAYPVTRSSPTTSPREFSTGALREVAGLEPEPTRGTRRARRRAAAGRRPRLLSAIPSPSRAAHSRPFGPALRDPAVAEAHELGVGRAVAADELRTRTHRVRGTRALRRAARGARTRAPSARASARRSRRRSRRPPSASSRLDLGRCGDLGEHRLLARMRREPVALDRPAALAAEEQHRRVLARAVVLEPRRLRAALEVVLGRARLREQALHRLELIGPVQVRRARDRDLGVVEVGSRADDRAAPGSASPSSGRT